MAVEQPWLLHGVPPQHRDWVERNLRASIVRVPTGGFAAEDLPQASVALMVLDGLLARRLHVRTYVGAELLGPGDLLRPWTYEGHVASVPAEAQWTALTETTIGLLDERFEQVAQRVPQVYTALLERSVERARLKGYLLAVRAAVRIEERLLLTLWHLAERWGRVTAEGVHLRLPRVSHDLLAELMGARRPSVTGAVNALEAKGVLERRGRGNWLLKGSPPEMFERVDS